MSADAFQATSADVVAAYPCGTGNELALYRASDLERLDSSALVPVRKRWPISATVLADAVEQTRPYNGDRDASDHAWSARVDAAVQGMDVVDSAGLDDWMSFHAAAEEPHLLEAELVAAWETHVRDLYADDLADQDDAVPPTAVAAPLAIEAPQRLAIEATAHSYDDVNEDGAWEL